jgi:hypothetical protein
MDCINTLHDNQMKGFISIQNTLPKKELKLKQLINKQSKMDMFNPMMYSLDNDIRTLKEEIESIKSGFNQVDYICKVAPILYKQSRGEADINTVVDANNNKTPVGILKYIESGSLGVAKAELLDEYMAVTGNSSGDKEIKSVPCINHICKKCSCNMIIDKKESTLSCPTCGFSEWFFDTDAPQWSDSVELSTQFAYERLSHFKEHLNQFQGKEMKDIPEELISLILMEMGKIRVHPDHLTRDTLITVLKKLKKSLRYNLMEMDKLGTHPDQLARKNTLNMLRKLRKSLLHNNVSSIYFRITGIKPPKLSPQLEERLIALFRIIQKPFEDHKPKDRKNFFSYPYTIRKLLEIIAEKDPSVIEYIEYFPLLKSREKLMLQDITWKKVCHSLGWPFSYSI